MQRNRVRRRTPPLQRTPGRKLPSGNRADGITREYIEEEAGLLTPSPELAARIQQWIDELPTEGLQYWLQRVCQELGALPLHGTMIYLWAVRPDGMVLRIDHEAFGHPVEPETDPLTVHAVILQGAQTYPELRDLRPLRPTGVHECDLCGGVGWVETAPGMGGSAICVRCNGLGQTISS